jgi:hypothetical protein
MAEGFNVGSNTNKHREWHNSRPYGFPLGHNGNSNVLSLDKGASKLAQGCVAQTALVEVERFDGEVLEITVFAPPRSVQS